MTHLQRDESWALQLDRVADELFPELQPGDVRRTRQYRRVVHAIARNPGASLPCIFPNPSERPYGKESACSRSASRSVSLIRRSADDSDQIGRSV